MGEDSPYRNIYMYLHSASLEISRGQAQEKHTQTREAKK